MADYVNSGKAASVTGHQMRWAADHNSGALPEVMAAVLHENDDVAQDDSYGDDATSVRMEALFNEVFEREVTVFGVATGTAANAVSIAAMCLPHQCVLCHEASHINVSECQGC
jgi:threonine aldolase